MVFGKYGKDFFNQPEARELQLQIGALTESRDTLLRRVERAEANLYDLQQVTTNAPAAPAANTLWNGELGHSVNSWFDSSYVSTDKAKECAHFFTHGKPFSPKTFTTIAVADTIPLTAHGLQTAQEVRLSTSGSLPTGLFTASTYFVIVVDANNIKVAINKPNAEAGTAVAVTAGTGSGTHKIYAYLDSTDSRTNNNNFTLKMGQLGGSPHTYYDLRYPDWDLTRGVGRWSIARSVDQPLPSNFVEPGNTLYLAFIAAKRNRYIDIPTTCRLGTGLWDATDGQNDFLAGSLSLSAEVVGTPAVTKERRYRIYIETDRGYSILSNEVTLAGAPDDAYFSSSVNVALSWRSTPGIRNIQIWRYTPASGTYHLLEELSGSTTFIDLNTTLRTGAGYPTATDTDSRRAVTYTLTGELSNINIDYQDPLWSTIRAVIPVPDNYNKGATTGRQWLRTWLTEDCDWLVGEITSDGSDTITAPATDADHPVAWEDGYGLTTSSKFVGLTAKIYNSSGTLIQTTTVVSRVSATQLKLAAAVPAASNQTIRLVGGGFHPIVFDKMHLTFQSNVSWAANPLDVRTLQPVAAPSSSSQGGVGGGGGGGIHNCLRGDVPIEGANGYILAEQLQQGDFLEGENDRPNLTIRVRTAMKFVRPVEVVTSEGVWTLYCTDDERFRRSRWDDRGTPLHQLYNGCHVIVNQDGRALVGEITLKERLPEPVKVYHPMLSGGHYFRAGTFRPNWRRRVKEWLGWAKQATGGVYIHNIKNPTDI